jgi:hypothetical protein
MKKRSFSTILNPGGVLRWSTFCILAGGAAGLTGCERGVNYVTTERDVEMAETQTRIEQIDEQQATLKRGEVSHNFHIPGVGYYHAEANDFFAQPQEAAGATVAASRPSPAALQKVDAALAVEQAREGAQPESRGSGFGMGNALMMYWLLAGNRGMFGAGSGFQKASGQAQNWQRGVETQRGAVGRHAAANPGYQRMVQQSRASGTPVRAGQSVRGGFGASRATGAPTGG